MSAVVGALRAILSLESAAFTNGLKKAEGGLRGFQERTQKFGRQLLGVGAVISGVGATILASLKGQIDYADEMAKASQKFGVPIERLTALQYAADLSGVSLETLGTGLRKLSQNMNDAFTGGKGNKTLFADLGIQITDASGQMRAADAVLGDVADTFASLPDGAQKTALAIKLFGKSGGQMIPLLNSGSAGLAAMAAEAKLLGVVIDSKTGRAAEAFNDNLSRIATAVKGVSVQLFAELAPTLVKISDAAVAIAKSFADLSPIARQLLAHLAGLVIVAGPIVVALGFAALAVSALAGAFASLIASPLVAGIAAIGAALTVIVGKAVGLTTIIDRVSDGLAYAVKVMGAFGNIIASVLSGLWSLVAASDGFVRGLSFAGSVLQGVWQRTFGLINDLIIAFSDILTATGGIGGAFVLLGDVASGVWEGIVGAARAIPVGLNSVWESVKAGFMRALIVMQETWLSFISVVSQTIANTPFLSDSGMGDALKAAANSGVDTLAKFDAAASSAETKAKRLKDEASALATEGFDKAKTALGALNVTVEETAQSMGDEPGSLVETIEETGTASGGAAEKMSAFQNVIKSLREEAQKLATSLRFGDLQAEIWEKQREAGVAAASVQGQQIAGLVTEIDHMKTLKEQTDSWRDSVKAAFTSWITGASSAKEALSQMLAKLAESAAGSAFDSLFGKSGVFGGLFGGLADVLGFAKGGVFQGGRVTAFAKGGVVNGATAFAMRGGLGVMGEAGPEAIFPLTKGPGGRLGVQATGGGGRLAVSIGFDQSVGGLTAMVQDEAGQVVASAIAGYDQHARRNFPKQLAAANKNPRRR